MLHVIAYDIVDDARRVKVADALKDFGRRVQYSVFEALLDADLLEQVHRRLERLIDDEADSVRIYQLCGACEGKLTIIGSGTRTVEEKVYVV